MAQGCLTEAVKIKGKLVESELHSCSASPSQDNADGSSNFPFGSAAQDGRGLHSEDFLIGNIY